MLCDRLFYYIIKLNLKKLNTGLLEHFLQLPRFVILEHNVQPGIELAVDINLGEGGPIREVLHFGAHRLIGQDVVRVDLIELDAGCLQDLNGATGEATLISFKVLNPVGFLIVRHQVYRPSSKNSELTCGASGVPFMKTTILFASTIAW